MPHGEPGPQTILSANAEAVTSLRRRLARAQRCFYVSLGLIGVGVPIAGVGLPLLLHDPRGPTGPIVILAGFLVACVGLGGILLMARDRPKYKGSLAVAAQADLMGFLFTERPRRDQYSWLRSLRSFRKADEDWASNLLTGQVAGTTVLILDYTAFHGGVPLVLHLTRGLLYHRQV